MAKGPSALGRLAQAVRGGHGQGHRLGVEELTEEVQGATRLSAQETKLLATLKGTRKMCVLAVQPGR
jgi:hypothetical protein